MKHTYKDVGHQGEADQRAASPDLPPQPISEAGEYIFTYDSRGSGHQVGVALGPVPVHGRRPDHWFSILNSLAIVLLLTGIVAMIMMRTLRRDLNRYNQEEKEELQESAGSSSTLMCCVRRHCRCSSARQSAPHAGATPSATHTRAQRSRATAPLTDARSAAADPWDGGAGARCSASSHPPTAAGC